MIKKLTSFLILLFMTLSASAYTQRNLLQHKTDVQQLKNMLVLHQKWVPYPDYTDREAWNKLMGDTREAYIRKGEQYLNYEWKVVKATDYIEYEKSGNRNIMQDPYGANNTAISALMMAELAEGKGRFIPQLINGVFSTCEKTSWVLSAHLASIQLSHKALPDYDDVVIDLTSGDVSGMLSWAYYFFHKEFDKVTPQISRRLYHELQQRQIEAYLATNRYWWMALQYKPGDMINNWNPWCNFNVLLSLMLIEDNPDKLAEGVYKTMTSVDQFLNYVKADGACEEGPSYWGHAAGKLFDYLQLLNWATDGKISLFEDAMVKNMGEYIARSYVGNGWVVNFADASAKGGENAPLIYRYGKAVNSPLMMKFASYLNHQNPKSEKEGKYASWGVDFSRSLQTLKIKDELEVLAPELQTPSYSWYPETEFCYMYNKAGMFVATKGGYNNESHNHNDAGTFSVYKHSVPLLIDAGVGTYTRQTFSSERYSIWTMQSNYHNLPMINDVSEKFGSEYKATGVAFNAKRMCFSANIATAYPQEAGVNEWIRSCTLKKDELLVVDRFSLKETRKPNRMNFLTWGKVDLTHPGEIRIEAMNEKCSVSYDAKLFDATIEKIQLSDPRLSKVWGNEIYRVSLLAKSMAKDGTYTFVVK